MFMHLRSRMIDPAAPPSNGGTTSSTEKYGGRSSNASSIQLSGNSSKLSSTWLN